MSMFYGKVHRVLFVEKLADGKPLFKNSAQLASAICDELCSNSKARSLATQLCSLIKGHRACSTNLEDRIRCVVRTEIINRCPTYLEQKCDEVIEALKETRRRKHKPIEFFRTAEEVEQIKVFFRGISRKGALLCIEYRDPPRTVPGEKYSRMAELAAEAIVSGLSLCMVQPFRSSPQLKQRFKHSDKVNQFLGELCERVRNAFLNIRNLAFKIGEERKVSQCEINSRIILIEGNSDLRDSTLDNFSSGIQSRLFYAYFPSDDSRFAPNIEQVWEWVAGEQRDCFVLRDKAIVPIIAQQYAPIVGRWTDKSVLPQSQKSLEQAINHWNEHTGASLSTKTWKLFTQTTSLQS